MSSRNWGKHHDARQKSLEMMMMMMMMRENRDQQILATAPPNVFLQEWDLQTLQELLLRGASNV